MGCRLLLVLFLAPVLGTSSVAWADLLLSTQPRGAYDKFAPPFEDVAAYLAKATGEKVTYSHSRDYLSYARDLRQDRFDIVFDEAHFVAWRIANRGHMLAAAAVPEARERHVVI